MVNSSDLLTSLSSKALCEKLRSDGAKVLAKVAQIFEEQEIDGDDLTLLTYEELSQLLPKLGMRKKLERFVGKLGFKLVTMPEDETSNTNELNPDLPALEPSTPPESANPSFELLSDSPSPEEPKKSKSPEKIVKTVLDLTGETGSNGKKKNDKEPQFVLPEGKCMPSVADLEKLARKYRVKFKDMRQAVEAAERMRRSVFVSGLPCCNSKEGIRKLINDLKRRIERKTNVSTRELDVTLKMSKSTGRVMVKSTKLAETANVVKALDGMFLEPKCKLFARRDSIPYFSAPSLKTLYEKIKPQLKKLYPNMVDSISARRTQEEHISRGNASSKPSEKVSRVWGKGRIRDRASGRPHSSATSISRRGYTQSKSNGHHLSNPRGNNRQASTAPSRFPRDRLPPRSVSKSQLTQSRVNGVIPERRPPIDRRMLNDKRRAPPMNRRALDRRAPPLDRRAPPIDRRAPPIDRRAQPIDRRAPPLDRRAPPVTRRTTLIEHGPLPVDRRQQQMATSVSQRPVPPVTQSNKWRTSRVIAQNQNVTRDSDPWDRSQVPVRRGNEIGGKHSILNRRSQEVNGLQARRPAALQRLPVFSRRPNEAPPSRSFPPPANIRDRGIPQRSMLQNNLPPPQRGTEIPYDYSRDTASRLFMERSNKLPTTRQPGRQQEIRNIPIGPNQGMILRGPRKYIDRMNMVPNLRENAGYEVKRIPSALQSRSINESNQRGPISRVDAPRGSMLTRQQGQRQNNRGQKRRFNEIVVKNPRESLFIERRINRGGNRTR
jgi:hypothetical protein